MDLQSLLSALQTTQQAKSAVKLSDRNVVELVNKLKQLGILGDDLLHTINGKEYITTDRLRQDVKAALRQVWSHGVAEGAQCACMGRGCLSLDHLTSTSRRGCALVLGERSVLACMGRVLSQGGWRALVPLG